MVRRLVRYGLTWAPAVGMTLVPSLTLAQDQTVQGFVADGATSELIPEATIVLVETGDETVSGSDGSFSLSDAPVGPISVQVSAPGYQGVLWETEVVPGRPLFLEVLLTRLEGNSSLSLVVTDEESGEPIAGAEVSLPELGLSAMTNEEGEARIDEIPAGNWLVVVSGFAYASTQSFIEFDGESVAEGEVALAEGPIYLEGLTITAEMRSRSLDDAGFYDRERRGFGYHFDPDDIEASVALVPSDLLRMVPGLNRPDQRMTGNRNPISGAIERTTLPACIWVEGVPWAGGNIDDLNIGWIEGVEVFTRTGGMPAQFDRAAVGCAGVMLIWLK